MSDGLQLAIAVVGLVGLAWFGIWLALGTLQSIAQSNQKTSIYFEGFVGNFAFLVSVACAAYTIAGTL